MTSGPVVQTRVRVAIGIGGALGAWARVGTDQLIGPPGHGWPWATFAVNVAGCLVLGYMIARLLERLPPSTYRRPLLGTGFCGALTTFSTMQVELLDLVRAQRAALAVGYAAASLAAGMAAFLLAVAVVRRARLRR
jgi:fluoride exporter